MKIAVIGGTGLIGSQVVTILNANGHEAVPHSLLSGLDLLKAGPVPYSIVRATQFFEFIDAMVSSTADQNAVRLPPTLVQPIAAADVAQAVADVAMDPPLRGTRSIAGPDVFRLDELGRITLAARGDHRTVITDNTAGMFAAAQGDALIAKEGAVIAKTSYQEWLAH